MPRMEIPTLNAKIRKETGRGLNVLRESGKIPGVFYGFRVENTPIELEAMEFDKIYKEAGENTIIKLNLEGKKDLKNDNILIQSVDKNPVTDKIIHVDLYAINMEKKIVVRVPLVFEGVSEIVKNQGGIIGKQLSELEVEASPNNIPREIKIDVSRLQTFDDVIRVGDIVLPEGVQARQEATVVVATVEEPKTEEEIKEELGAKPEEKVSEVKVVGEEEKKGEEGDRPIEVGGKEKRGAQDQK